MSSRKHHLLSVNGIRIHAVEEGSGPLVLLVHGFPESWYSWRHQLTALAAAGYRAVAIDQRGYGRSSKPSDLDAYRIHHLVADVVGVVAALGETTAVIIGHDWGAPVAWTAAWLHPEIFRGVIGMSVPFSGRGLIPLPGSPFGERHPGELHAELAGPGQTFYQDYFGAMTASVAEIVEFGLYGWALSRFSGAWVGFKAISETVESSASIVSDPDRIRIITPDDFEMPPGGWWRVPPARSAAPGRRAAGWRRGCGAGRTPCRGRTCIRTPGAPRGRGDGSG